MQRSAHSAFRAGGGAMGARLRAFDWGATPLGPIDGWPAALRITVDQMLASKLPMCLFWGPQLITLYNDAYRPILGDKPEALGQPLPQIWSEAWPQVRPMVERALAGSSTFIEDFRLRLQRHGAPEDAFFTFNYGPVFDEGGAVCGMLATVVETTLQVLAERASRKERWQQQQLMRRMPGFVAVLGGPEHVFEYVNDAYVRIAGARDYLGRSVRAAMPELQGQGFYEILDRVYTSGEPFKAEALPVTLAGADAPRYVDLLYEPIRDGRGRIRGVFAGGYDVTERVLAESRLRALNATLEQRVVERTLARGRAWQVSPELLSVLGPDGYFETVNPAWEKTLGWSEAELLGTPWQALLHPEDQARVVQAFDDALQRGIPVLRLQSRWRSRAGRWRWLSWVAVPEDERLYGIARDVTSEVERRAALAQRTAERDWLAAIVESTAVLLQALDLDYRFLAINAAAAAEYERGCGRRPRVGDRLPDILRDLPAERDAMMALWSRALGGEAFTVQQGFGEPQPRRYYEMRFEVLRGADGRRTGAFLTSTDITERLQEQRALAEAQDALRQAQKMEAVGQLTGGIAHDFNNLLAAIGGALQMAQQRLAQGSDDVPKYLEMGAASARRAASLTQRLLAFSRRQTLDPKPLDVNRLIDGMAELIARTVGPGVELSVQAAPGLWATRADPSQLENALLNLCINARDAMPGGGRLVLSTRNCTLGDEALAPEQAGGDYVCLEVRDTGAGMPPSVLQRAFEPFFTTKPLGRGTGLGLSMVYGFVRQSGGQVQLRSQVDEGTRVLLYLPRYAGEAVHEPAPAQADAPARAHGETVLLIEDEPTVRTLLQEVLEEAGYTVLSAGDGPGGMRMLQSDAAIDLLMTDVGLPGGMNGRQVADAGRLLRPRLKVLFITGYAESAAVGNGLMDDGMEVMTKPFDMDAMLARVRSMLEG